jgi:hypothetical protein
MAGVFIQLCRTCFYLHHRRVAHFTGSSLGSSVGRRNAAGAGESIQEGDVRCRTSQDSFPSACFDLSLISGSTDLFVCERLREHTQLKRRISQQFQGLMASKKLSRGSMLRSRTFCACAYFEESGG